MKIEYLFGLLFLITASFLPAQEIEFESQAAKTEVAVNERFVVKFILTHSQRNISVDKPIELPDFGKLIKLNESQTSSFQFVNGKVTNENGVEVLLVAEREGEYNIDAATVTIDGKRYKTKPLKIRVTKETHNANPGGQRIQGAFLSAEVSNENPFLNQELILSIKIYARDYSLMRRMQNYREPVFTNLVARKVEEQGRNNERQVLVNGRTFISKEIARYVIFPQKAGKVTIDPFTLNILLSGYYGAEEVLLGTEPVTLEVKNLPGGKPKNFSGAVGEFQLNAFISDTEVNADESITLEWEIVGSGNLNTLKPPLVKVPEDIEIYTPQKREAIEIYPSGMKGKVSESRVLVPHFGGEYEIEPITFNYFDPEKEEYQSLSSEGFNLKVKGPKPPVKDTVTEIPQEPEMVADRGTTRTADEDTAVVKEPVAIPQKILRAKDEVAKKVENTNAWFWSILGASVLGLLAFLLVRRKNSDEEEPNEREIRKQFRSDISEKLGELKKMRTQKDNAAFLSLQEEILTKIGMKYSNTELAEFTETDVVTKLEPKFGDIARRWRDLLLQCKEAKYAYSGRKVDLPQMFKETENLWKDFQKRA